jgi:hypothetical protein
VNHDAWVREQARRADSWWMAVLVWLFLAGLGALIGLAWGLGLWIAAQL